MFPGAAIDDGIAAAGIIADHAADHRPIGRRGFGTEQQTVRPEEQIKIVADNARLYPHPALIRVQLDYSREMTRYVDDDPIADYLSGQRSTRRPGDQRCMMS